MRVSFFSNQRNGWVANFHDLPDAAIPVVGDEVCLPNGKDYTVTSRWLDVEEPHWEIFVDEQES